jgi:hypothetical protein
MTMTSKTIRLALLLNAALAIGSATASEACTLHNAKCLPPPNSGPTVKQTGGIGSGGTVSGPGGGDHGYGGDSAGGGGGTQCWWNSSHCAIQPF